MPKTPNVRGNINQETRQVAIQLSNDIVEDGENMDCGFVGLLSTFTVAGITAFIYILFST